MRVFRSTAMVCVAVLASLGAAAPAQEAAPAGVVVAAVGPVSVHRAGDVVDVHPGFALQPGDSLVMKLGASCRGFTPLGEVFDHHGPAFRVFAPPTQENFRSRVTQWFARELGIWIGQRRSQSLIARSGGEWAASGAAVRTLLPANGGRVRASGAYLLWQKVDGVDRYTVTIASADGGEVSSTVRGNDHTASGLTPGGAYAWKAGLELGGASLDSRWSEFRVMTEEEEQSLDASLADLSDLMAGVVLLCTGLHREAIERLDAAVDDPESLQSALFWRARALAEAGRYDRAYEDMLKVLGED